MDSTKRGMSRRDAVKWMLAAAATVPWLQPSALAADPSRAGTSPAEPQPAAPPIEPLPARDGYGTDPDLTKTYGPGDFWPLTFTPEQRRTAAALCALIIPADEHSPSAADVGVPDFIDEWISAPYPEHGYNRVTILTGLRWLDAEAQRRFSRPFADLPEAQGRAICDDICWVPKATQQNLEAAGFFAMFRNLTAAGFYTTPEGMKDLGYVGNTPQLSFEGPPEAALRKAGLIA